MDEEFREGMEAYLDDIPRSECPYTEEATKALWLAGWDWQDGYKSWSPAVAFEDGYSSIDEGSYLE